MQGCTDYTTKPINAKALVELIAGHLEGRAAIVKRVCGLVCGLFFGFCLW